MNIYAWLLIGWLTAEALSVVWLIGKERKVITNGFAVAAVVQAAMLAWVVSLAATR